MSDCESMSAEVRGRLRSIPAVHELLAEWPVMKAAGDAGDTMVREAIDAELDAERAAIRSGAPARDKRELALAIEQRTHRLSLPTLRPAVNATGVVIHTNLGRAPLAPAAVQAVTDVARGYSTLEYDVSTCARGGRKEHAARLLRTLTGAQDALVVNNNAAAVLLVLAAHAFGKEVIVSRGELVEVGGSFRIPDIMAASGAKLVEVGSTNRTHLDDYRNAITPNTAMILKVHPSNYRIEGFHEEVPWRSFLRWRMNMACCFTRTKAQALCLQMGYSPMRGRGPRPCLLAPALTSSRARATNCSVLRRRASSSAAPGNRRLRLSSAYARASPR